MLARKKPEALIKAAQIVAEQRAREKEKERADADSDEVQNSTDRSYPICGPDRTTSSGPATEGTRYAGQATRRSWALRSGSVCSHPAWTTTSTPFSESRSPSNATRCVRRMVQVAAADNGAARWALRSPAGNLDSLSVIVRSQPRPQAVKVTSRREPRFSTLSVRFPAWHAKTTTELSRTQLAGADHAAQVLCPA